VVAGFTNAGLDLSVPGGPPALAVRLGYPVVLAQQVHGVALKWVDQLPVDLVHDAGRGDALATRLGGVVLVIKTADCVPVLLADPTTGLVAAVHAGWRGVIRQIVPRVVQRLGQLGAANLRAAIGPAICAQCYPVSPSLAGQFATVGLPVGLTEDGEPSLDLVAGVRAQLQGIGVSQIEDVGQCTKCSPGYFSYRRQGRAAGRQCAWIRHVKAAGAERP